MTLKHPEYARGISSAELIKEAIEFCDTELDSFDGMDFDSDSEVCCQRSNTFIRELARRLETATPAPQPKARGSGGNVMSAALLPCPFCGSRFKMSQEPNDNHPVAGMVYLYHEYGPLGSPARSCPLEFGGHFESEEVAIKAWNTRSPAASEGHP